MPISINGTTGISGVDGSAAAPALQGSDTNTGIAFGSDVIIGSTGGTERFRCDSSGRLLVGASTSSTSWAGFTPSVQIAGTSSLAAISVSRYSANDATPQYVLQKSRNATIGSHTIVSSGDEVGSVSFEGSDGANFIAAAQIRAFVDGTPGANDMPGRLVFSTTADGASSPTERMRINNDGGIAGGGNTSTNNLFGSQGFAFSVASGNFNGFSLNKNSTSWGTALYIHRTFQAGTGTLIEFAYNTNTMGTISTNGSATAYNTSSDYRLKENVVPVADGITRLQQLKPSRFNFIADPDKTVDGFIAHEVQTVVPEAITGEKDAVDDDGNPIYQGIDQSKLVPLLTAALQEAIAKIESLETRLAALEVTP